MLNDRHNGKEKEIIMKAEGTKIQRKKIIIMEDGKNAV